MLKIKLRKFDLDLKVLNKKIAKSGLDVSDLTDELEEVRKEEEEEANKPFVMPTELTSVDVNEKPPENAEQYILNEIELLKFQNQTEIEEVKIEYEKQIEALNNKVLKFCLELLLLKNSKINFHNFSLDLKMLKLKK